MSSKVYSPKQVKINFVGIVDNVTGWESINIDRIEDNSTPHTSSDGKTTYSKSSDFTGSLGIEVQQVGSEMNLALAAVNAAQDTADDLFFFDVVITDKSNSVVCNMINCHLQKYAPQDIGKEATTRTHTLHIEKLQYVPVPEGSSATTDAAINATNVYSNVLGLLG